MCASPLPPATDPHLLVQQVKRAAASLGRPGLVLLAHTQIRITESVPSLALSEGDGHLVLEVNPHFVATHVRTPADLRFLVLHELYHHRFGHLESGRPVTPEENIARDALINAHLCMTRPDPEEWAILTRIYPATDWPLGLLRPPPDWPDGTVAWPFAGERGQVHQALYSDASVTVQEIVELLRAQRPGDLPPSRVPLLGRHDGGTGEVRSPVLQQVIDEVVRANELLWAERAAGRSLQQRRARVPRWPGSPGCRQHWRLQHRPAPAEWRRRLREALARLDAARPVPPPPEAEEETTRYLPGLSASDRRACVLGTLGEPPLLQRQRHLQARTGHAQGRPPERVRLFLDVSGSMSDVLPALYDALTHYGHHFHPRVHLFSVGVREIDFEDLRRGRVDTDGGTALDGVLKTLRRYPNEPALIVTDGLVRRPRDARARPAGSQRRGPPGRVVVLLAPHGDDAFARDLGWPVVRCQAPAPPTDR